MFVALSVHLVYLPLFLQELDQTLAALVLDLSWFIVCFDSTISASTPHIYVSALPFSPPDCLITKQYRSQFPKTLAVVSRGVQNWPASHYQYSSRTHRHRQFRRVFAKWQAVGLKLL